MNKTALIASLIFLSCAMPFTAAHADGHLAGEKTGTIELQSIGPIAFGPDGILFIADPKASTVYAMHTLHPEHGSGTKSSNPHAVKNIDKKIAAMLGIGADELIIHDFAVDPMSGAAYLSVSRGRGPDASPVLIRRSTSDELGPVSLENVSFTKATLWATPDKDRRGRDIRQDAITEIAYIDGSVVVAGLSNQEFSSRLRVLDYPFTAENRETGLEIYHTSHGQWETHSPVRTFTPFMDGDQPYILAAHTCTPLVRIPVSEIVSDKQKVIGTTIAELGNRNRPLDMLIYEKDGEEFLLITNSSRGVMKLSLAPMPKQPALTEEVPGTAGADIIQIAALEGTLQIEAWGEDGAVVLRKNAEGSIDLAHVALP